MSDGRGSGDQAISTCLSRGYQGPGYQEKEVLIPDDLIT